MGNIFKILSLDVYGISAEKMRLIKINKKVFSIKEMIR